VRTDCEKCSIPIDEVLLPCGHTMNQVPCHAAQDIDRIKCSSIVSKWVLNCNHAVEVPCSVNVTEGYRCPVACEKILNCGHGCSGTCGICCQKDEIGAPVNRHQACRRICGRKYATCNHTCKRECHDGTDCGLCDSPCEVSIINETENTCLCTY
jgi:hypothetical protein